VHLIGFITIITDHTSAQLCTSMLSTSYIRVQ